MVLGSSHQLKRCREWILHGAQRACGGGSIGDGAGDGVKAGDNGVGWCDGRDGEVVMT
jgi:hypothetical protein